MAQNKKWHDFPAAAKIAIIAAGTAQMVLIGAAHADISRRPADQIRGGKAMWRLISLVNFVGPILYFRRGRISLES